VAEHYGIAADSFSRQRSGAVSRDLAAWLARELTPVTLRELSTAFGLTHPDSVRNLIRRADRALLGSRLLRGEIEAIRHRLPKTGPDPAKPLDPVKPLTVPRKGWLLGPSSL
jgi:chromosomal replication initiation ATPase DnaA